MFISCLDFLFWKLIFIHFLLGDDFLIDKWYSEY